MILNEREVKILEKFYNNEIISLTELAKEFSVSERMIRYNINEINTLLEFIKINPIKKIGKSKYLLESNSEKLLDIIKELEPIGKSKRQILIQMYILYSKNKLKIKDFIEKFQLTRVSINSDIKEINKILIIRGFRIVNKNGLSFCGNTENIKKYKIFLLSEQLESLLSEETSGYLNILKEIIFSMINEKTFIRIKKFVNDVLNENKIKVDDLNYKYFYSEVVNTFINDIEYDIKLENLVDKEYVIKKFKELKLLKDLENKKIEEISNLVTWIKSYERYEDFFQDLLNIEMLVKNIIKTVESKILIPITKDKLLEEFLIQHLKELIYRTRKGYKLKDYIVEEKEEDKLYLIIKKSLELITQQLGSEIEKDEIHLLKIHFLASMERINKLKIVPLEIIIITSLGSGSKKILIDNIKSQFLVNVVYVGPLYRLSLVLKEYKNVNYILTTIDIEESKYKNKEIVKINTILSADDKQKLTSLGFRSNNNKINLSNLIDIISKNCGIENKNNLIENLMNNFNDRIVNDISEFSGNEDTLLLKNIIFDYEAIDINDAIKKCCEKLEEDYTDSTYTKDVLDIYKHNQMQIIRFNGVLLPHAVNKNNVYKNGVSILKLKTPVTIEKTKDKIDTIVCFAIRDKNNIGNDISNIINKVLRPKFKKIIKDKDKIGIINYLIN
ncbi:MAG: PTS sugar transporter subunit IIA [Leptotrichiaceae bacterium]|nr:PTS sugar transporter subunit IIA [Leptotrichiaceae bacterium]MBP7739516.1 PTS sugar transporter subunit IIA [Leptotrichiaceae bacterium]